MAIGLVVAMTIAATLMVGCVTRGLRAAPPQQIWSPEALAAKNEELAVFVDAVYKEPYSLLFNNCINKSLRIKAEAERLGMKADLIGCIAILPAKRWHNFPIVSPHVYTEIDGRRVDVALDPAREEIYCKNSEQRIVMPVNLSPLERAFSRRVGFAYLLRGGRGKRDGN